MTTNDSMDAANNTGILSEASESEFSTKMRYVRAALVLSWIYTVLIIVLNLAVIVIIKKYNKRSRLYFLLLNIAIADLLTGLLDAFPNSIERSFSLSLGVFDLAWPLGRVACKIQRTVANTVCMASNYILAAASVDRTLVVCKPMASFGRRGNRVQTAMVIGCWLGSLVPSCWYLYDMDVFLITDYQACYSKMVYKRHLSPTGIKIYLFLQFLALVVIPLLCIVTSYIFLVINLYRRAAALSQGSVDSGGIRRISMVFNRGIPRTKRRSIKLTIGITAGFLFAWLAHFGFQFRQLFHGNWYNIDIVFVTCYFWNSIVNPVAFFIFHRMKERTPVQVPNETLETNVCELNDTETKPCIKVRNSEM